MEGINIPVGEVPENMLKVATDYNAKLHMEHIQDITNSIIKHYTPGTEVWPPRLEDCKRLGHHMEDRQEEIQCVTCNCVWKKTC